jgi:hypothetical protein
LWRQKAFKVEFNIYLAERYRLRYVEGLVKAQSEALTEDLADRIEKILPKDLANIRDNIRAKARAKIREGLLENIEEEDLCIALRNALGEDRAKAKKKFWTIVLGKFHSKNMTKVLVDGLKEYRGKNWTETSWK